MKPLTPKALESAVRDALAEFGLIRVHATELDMRHEGRATLPRMTLTFEADLSLTGPDSEPQKTAGSIKPESPVIEFRAMGRTDDGRPLYVEVTPEPPQRRFFRAVDA